MKVHVIFSIVLAMVSSLIVTSCQTPITYEGEKVSLEAIQKGDRHPLPQFWVTFLPFSPLDSEHFTAGKPTMVSQVRLSRGNFDRLTNEAIAIVLKEISDAGFDGVLLSIHPEDLIDAKKCEKIKTFFVLAEQECIPIRIGLFVRSQEPLIVGSGNICQFLYQQGFSTLPCQLHYPKENSGFLVVIDGSNITVNRQNFQEERHIHLVVTGASPNSPHHLKPAHNAMPNIQGGYAWVHAADSNHHLEITYDHQAMWRQPRGDGSFLQNSLRAAFAKKTDVICIQSWNDLSDGSFIAPNTFDNSLLLKAFGETKHEIETFVR